MCLAVPGKLVHWIDHEVPFARAFVEFASIGREVSMQCVPDAEVGDYVLVHAGIAISQLDAEEATRILQTLDDLDLLEDVP